MPPSPHLRHDIHSEILLCHAMGAAEVPVTLSDQYIARGHETSLSLSHTNIHIDSHLFTPFLYIFYPRPLPCTTSCPCKRPSPQVVARGRVAEGNPALLRRAVTTGEGADKRPFPSLQVMHKLASARYQSTRLRSCIHLCSKARGKPSRPNSLGKDTAVALPPDNPLLYG